MKELNQIEVEALRERQNLYRYLRIVDSEERARLNGTELFSIVAVAQRNREVEMAIESLIQQDKQVTIRLAMLIKAKQEYQIRFRDNIDNNFKAVSNTNKIVQECQKACQKSIENKREYLISARQLQYNRLLQGRLQLLERGNSHPRQSIWSKEKQDDFFNF